MRAGCKGLLTGFLGLLASGVLTAATLPTTEKVDVPALLRAGKEFYQQGKLPEALARFEEVLKVVPGDLVANHHVARIRAQIGDFKAAIDVVRKLQRRGISIYRSEDSRTTLDVIIQGILRADDLRQRADLIVHLRETIAGLPAPLEESLDAHLMAIYAKLGENHLFDVVKGRFFASRPAPPVTLFVAAQTYLEYEVNLSEAVAYLEQAIDALKEEKLRPSGNPLKDRLRQKRLDAQVMAYEDYLAYAYAAAKQFSPERNRFLAAEPEPKAKFADVTEAAGLKGVTGHRVAVGDFDGDGFEDLCVAGRIFRNNSGKTFTEVTKEAKVDPRGAFASLWLDYDNDGRLDLLCVHLRGFRLWRNVGGGAFEDATEKAGLSVALPGIPEAVAAADYDGDGLPDLFVGCSEDPNRPGIGQPNFLLHNNGKGGFEDASGTAGIRGKEEFCTRACAWGDFNNDGRPDLYVANGRFNRSAPRLGLHPNQLWVNQGDGKFVDQAEARGVRGVPGEGQFADVFSESTGCTWGDFNNDGNLDLVVARQAAGEVLLLAESTAVYLNGGKGANWPFSNIVPGSGIRFEEMVVGAGLADFDNDGDLDLYLTCIYKERPTFLYQNVGENKFQPVTWKAGALAFSAVGQAWFDKDNDGDLDLVLGTVSGVRLFENQAKDTSWLRVQLIGKRSNRQGIGARITATAGPLTMLREVTCGQAATNQSSPIAHFGLGGHQGPVQLVIRWPDGHNQSATADKPNQLLKIEEK